ncbi:hypothetical protein DFH28DRAFT_1180780 [Melampsora americana]|nr:hypothetical protein DFH28DRAFT_1180780 [Melampsora americana]
MSLNSESNSESNSSYASSSFFSLSPGDEDVTRYSVVVKDPTCTGLLMSGPFIPASILSPSASLSQSSNPLQRSNSAPASLFRPCRVDLSQAQFKSTSQTDLSPISIFEHRSYLCREEFEADKSDAETSRSFSTNESDLTATSSSDQTHVSGAATPDDESSSSTGSKVDRFFDEDVIFPALPDMVEGSYFPLLEEVKWEDWARRRIVKMIEQEPCVQDIQDIKPSVVSHTIMQEVIKWLINFEHCFKQYPNLSLPTRHRAIMLFCRFCSLAITPINTEESKVRAHQIGVACLTLACKVDFDSLRPLTVVPLKLWAESVLRGGWVAVCSQELRASEKTITETLSYQLTFPTPCDFLAELVIAVPMLDSLTNHCLEDWEIIGEGFSSIYDHAFHHPEYLHHRSAVLTVAILLLSLDECIFDHPGPRTKARGLAWWRGADGIWTRTREKDSMEPTSYHLASDVEEGSWITLVRESIKTSICEIMSLNEVGFLFLFHWPLCIQLSASQHA